MSTIKKTIEEVRNAFNKRGLYLDEKEYNGKLAKMKCHDDDGYYYSLSYGNISDKRTKTFNKVAKTNNYSIQNIQKYIYNNGYKTEVLSKEYINEKSKIQCKCECGKIFTTYWNHILCANKFTCTECGIKRKADARAYPVEYVKEHIKEYGFDLLEDTYTNIHNFSIQDKDGYRYKTSYYNIINTKRKFDKFDKFNPYTVYNLNLYISLNNIPVKLIDNTERQIEVGRDYIDFYCADCGKSYKAQIGQVLYGNRYRCKKCCGKESNNEYYVRKYLEDKNIEFIQEKRFKDCKNNKPLPFDFYIPSINYVIEVHGGQHYYENHIFAQSLEERQRIDKVKQSYCENNRIGYLEIPFWAIERNTKEEYKNMIDKILEKA